MSDKAPKNVRAVCITSFRTEVEFRLSLSDSRVSYACYQLEICPRTSRQHQQAYVEFGKPTNFASIKKLMPGDHIEPRQGTATQARAYCYKTSTALADSFYEQGVFSADKNEPGKRVDIEGVVAAIASGGTLHTIMDEHPQVYFRYPRAVHDYLTRHAKQRDWVTELHIYTGATGGGKSWRAHNAYPAADTFQLRRSTGTVWWCGYHGQKHVIIDDFYGWLPYSELLRLADRYPLRIDFKGGSTEFLAERITITSNAPWQTWWKVPVDKSAFARRITDHLEYTAAWVPPVDQPAPPAEDPADLTRSDSQHSTHSNNAFHVMDTTQ